MISLVLWLTLTQSLNAELAAQPGRRVGMRDNTQTIFCSSLTGIGKDLQPAGANPAGAVGRTGDCETWVRACVVPNKLPVEILQHITELLKDLFNRLENTTNSFKLLLQISCPNV